MPRPKKAIPIERYTVRTMREVGAVMGISAMRVCQLEHSALRKLGRAFQKAGITKEGRYES